MPRRALVDRLLAAPSAPVICVVAPPGYGKTTLLAQWSAGKGDRAGWVSVDRRDNDPAVLLTYIAAALDRIQPVDPEVFDALTSPGVSVLATVMPRFLSALAAMAQPVALLRAQGQVVEVGVADLAMSQGEAQALLEATGVGLSGADMNALTGRTEGWPAGLYLAALAHKTGGRRRDVGFAVTGDDRFIADYLHSELLGQLPPELVTFLTRTAVLERMCGPLCDAVLATSESGKVLAALEDSNLLLVPLDRRHHWYRYHHLFGELLGAEPERREPELVSELHARAARWHEANGLPEVAVDHAQAAGDPDLVARLVAGLVFPTYAGGRVGTVRRWLAWFEERGLVERYPTVAVLGAWVQALTGRAAAAERWADAADHQVTALAPGAQTPADGSTMESYLAMLRGLSCRNGAGRMRLDAQAALAGLGPASPWRAATLVIEGAADLLDGRADEADAVLAHAVQVGTDAGAMPAVATALAERCLVAIQRDDWDRAERLAGQALAVLAAGQLDDYVMSPLVHAVAARTALHRGDAPGASDHLAHAARLRPLLTYAIPWGAVQTLLELGRAYLMLDDAAGARAVLWQARDILQLRPSLGVLPAQVEKLRARLEGARKAGRRASSLSTAELRLLPLLATHLTFPEIGERLFVSRNTVKTQAVSIYRKLGTSSRSQAVRRLQELGLLEG